MKSNIHHFAVIKNSTLPPFYDHTQVSRKIMDVEVAKSDRQHTAYVSSVNMLDHGRIIGDHGTHERW